MPERFDHIPGDPDHEPSVWPPATWIGAALIVLAVTAILGLAMLFVSSVLSGS